MENKIKVGYLISYDYKYLEASLPTIYKEADFIALAIDKDRRTWNGKNINIPNSFFEWINEFDADKKIHIYEDSFYQPSLNPMECETRERNMLAKFMGEGEWHVQIDADEYFLDFSNFVKYLKSLNINIPTSIYAELITIFKQNNNDMFLIDSCETFPLATNKPVYIKARTIEKLKKTKYTKFKILHQSWGRSEEEMAFKLKNWGHTNDFNIDAYFDLWKVINKHTFAYISNFHPLAPKVWEKLEYVEAESMPILIEKVKEIQAIKREKQKKEDNKLKNRIRSLFRKKKRR